MILLHLRSQHSNSTSPREVRGMNSALFQSTPLIDFDLGRRLDSQQHCSQQPRASSLFRVFSIRLAQVRLLQTDSADVRD